MVAFAKSDHRIPRLHRVRRRLADGRVSTHWYHRPTKTKLPSPDSPEFQLAYTAAEQQWATQQLAAKLSEPPAVEIANQSPTEVQPSRKSPPTLVTRKSSVATVVPPPAAVLRIRRRAAITQAEVARIIRAAKQAGAAQIEVRLTDSSRVIVHLQRENSAIDEGEIIL
jgi:hypothetical protein